MIERGAMKVPNDSVDRIVSAFENVDLGDPRRTERLENTLRRLAESPRSTIPDAMVTEAELEGAYRFFRSPHVTMEALTLAHAEATAARAREVGRVLAIHDTTTCEFAHADPAVIGYLSTGKAGFMAHYSLIVADDGSRRPLGVANTSVIHRDRPPARPSKNGRKLRNKNGVESAKNPERESLRWSRGFVRTSERLAGCSVIHVADREGDSYELLGTAVQQQLRFVIRCRVPDRRATSEEGSKSTVRAIAEASTGLFKREVELSARQARPEPRERKAHPPRATRTATLSYSATTIEIVRPRYLDSLPATLSLNMVRVYEQNAPEGEQPIEWLLFTTEPVSTKAEVEAVVDIYRARWLIEECNKAIKTGCRYEERHFESRQALLNLLALTLPIACELLWLRSCSRTAPNTPADRVLSRTQLQILNVMGSYVLPANPTAHDALRAVAALGGHIRSNGDPGWLVLHRGLAKLLAYEEGWLARENVQKLSISR
jgi:Transposase DNA-binding/Transposase DDE domain